MRKYIIQCKLPQNSDDTYWDTSFIAQSKKDWEFLLADCQQSYPYHTHRLIKRTVTEEVIEVREATEKGGA